MAAASNHVVTDRGGVVENRHIVHAVVVDSNGTTLLTLGDWKRMTLIRSAAKPAQALAILSTGCFDRFDLTDADLALMCASHSSEGMHIARAREMLRKIEASESDLRCGGHFPLSEAVNRSWIREDFAPTPICSNCSGKHVGMLAAARALDLDMDDYHSPDHPLQIHVKQVVEELAGAQAGEVAWSLDGCNLPAPACPLYYLARMYATFADSADPTSTDASTNKKEQYMARIFKAMDRYPDMVGGSGRFCTALIKAYDGQLIGKVGADGCYGVAIKASPDTARLGATRGLGIAVKVEDGNIDILYAAVCEILAQLGIGTEETRSALESFHHPKRTNTVGAHVGDTSFVFELKKA